MCVRPPQFACISPYLQRFLLQELISQALFCTHTTHSSTPNLSLSIDLLLVESLITLVDILIRGWCLLLITVQWLISSLARSASVLHPQEYNGLANQHSDSRSSHTKSDTDQDGYKDNLEGSPKNLSQTMEEALVVVVVAMAVRLEVNVRGKLHGAVWKSVGHSILAWTLVVMGMGMGVGVVLVAGELVEAFHTEMLDLMAGSLGRILGFGHAGDHFGEDAAQDGFTFGVWGVWRNGDSLDGVEDECSVLFLDCCDLDVVDLDHLAIKTHDSHKHSDERIVFELLLVILDAVAESQVAVVALHVG